MNIVDNFRDIGQRSRAFGHEVIATVETGGLILGAVALLGIQTTVIRRSRNPNLPIEFEVASKMPTYDPDLNGWILESGETVGINNNPNDPINGKVLLLDIPANGPKGKDKTWFGRGSGWFPKGPGRYGIKGENNSQKIEGTVYFLDLDLEISNPGNTSPLGSQNSASDNDHEHQSNRGRSSNLFEDDWIPMEEVPLD